MFEDVLVMIRGAGDLASGVAWRLHRCRFPVVLIELPEPLVVRRTVAFAQAVFDGECTVQGTVARLAHDVDQARVLLTQGVLPLLVDPEAESRRDLQPSVLIDAIMAKANTGTAIQDAQFVIGLGPGFHAGQDCHAVVETNRGHDLGRVIWQGEAAPDTKVPGEIGGYRAARVLRSPAPGQVHPYVAIGDRVQEGQLIAWVGSSPAVNTPLVAPFSGMLRGLVHPAVHVQAGMKIGDLDARGERRFCFTISDKSLAVAGGVLEAVLTWLANTR